MDLYESTAEFCRENGIESRIKSASGILVAFSGGADSSLLLDFLVSTYGKERISACHVNHMIRGEEADRDEEFCRGVAERYGIDFYSKKINVPEIAARDGLGTEEAARRERYGFLQECAGDRLIATAHNATDNMETMIFNLARGTGIRGMGGIAPIRGNVIRPLLSHTGEEIRWECERRNIAWVTDSTNASLDYTRNFIRSEIVPKLRKLNPAADGAMVRSARIARETCEYIEAEGLKLIEDGNFIFRERLKNAERPVAVSALRSLYAAAAGTADGLSEVHLRDAYAAAFHLNGELSMPHGVKFICSEGKLRFGEREKKEFTEESIILPVDGKVLPFGEYFAICASREPSEPIFDENIYNLFIKETMSFDTIDGSILVRCRQPGDKILNGGMHKKLKKLMCDKNVPEKIRGSLPVLCDNSGILLVPGVCRRDGTDGCNLTVYIFRLKGNT